MSAYTGRQVASWAGGVWIPRALKHRQLHRITDFVKIVKSLRHNPLLPADVEALSDEEHDHYKALGLDYRFKRWSQRVGWLYW